MVSGPWSTIIYATVTVIKECCILGSKRGADRRGEIDLSMRAERKGWFTLLIREVEMTWFPYDQQEVMMLHVWQYDLGHTRGRPPLPQAVHLGPHPAEVGGSSGGWKSTIWSLLQRAGLHIIYILFGKTAFWNPSARRSQRHHQRHLWDKSMQGEEPGNPATASHVSIFRISY